MNKFLTKAECVDLFETYIKPFLIRKYGMADKVAIRCGWNDFIDDKEKSGLISNRSRNWTNPYDK